MASAESLKIDPLTQQQGKSFDTQDNDMSSGPSSLGMLYTNSSLEGLQTNEQRLVLDIIAQLRKCGLESVISLPQLVVSGDQSAGKSSVLEALTEIPFPRSDNLCTRHATEIILRPGAVESLAVKVIPDSKRPSCEQDRIKAFTESIMNLDELPDTMAKAMALMGIESDPTSGSNSRVFSRDVLSVEIEGPSRPQLTLVDIPGLIQNETKGATRADVYLVAEMTEHYISQPRTICLAVISATNDYANQGILTKVRKVDPDGDRTLGIITKPDRLEAGSGMEQAFIGLTRNQDIFLKLGWHVLKNRSFDEGTNSFVERNLSEKTYFHKSNFKVLPQDCVGIDSLRDRLSKLLFNHVKQELPKLREDLETALSDSRTQLETMGNRRATLQDCRDYLTSLSLDYYEICKAAVNGHYEGLYFTSGVDEVFSIASPATIRRLRAAVQHMNAKFSNSIRTIGHKYHINRSSDAEINDLDSFAASEEEEEPILPDIKPGSPTRMSHTQALSWVSQALTRTRGKELSGNFNPLLVGELFWEQSSNWGQLATEHVEHVGHICSKFLEALLHDKCPKDIQSRLWSSQIQDTIKSRNEASICELRLIIEDLRSYPMNYNHYYTDTIEKQRREREEKDLTKCIEAATKHTKLDGCHSSHTSASIDIKHVVKEHSQHTDPDMEKYACEQALDCLFAIYKVSQKTFIANITTQVVERHIVRGLEKIFSPISVNRLSDAEVEAIASEPTSAKRQREFLEDRIRKLDKGRTILPFSAGYTFAEAANYADQNWNIQEYQECDSRYCSEGFIRKEMLEFRNEGEEQHSEGSSEDDGSLAEETQTQARKDDNFAVKRRNLSPKKLVQSTTAVQERGDSSNKAAKRKPVSQDTPKKIPKLQPSFTNNASAFFSGLTPIPKSIIHPANIYQIFTDRSESGDSDTIWLLTRLFFAIGSPDAFYQLRDACSASRQVKELAVSRSTNSISEAVQALDQLDITVITASILRRFYLTFLVTQRYERERHHQSQRPKRVLGSQNFSYTKVGHDTGTATKQDCLGRADTKALIGLMAEAYPSLKPTRKRNIVTDDEYQKKLSSLKVRLRDGRNWYTMQQRLPPGILALVPTRGDYQIQNREVERLSMPLFTLFLDVLIEFRGDFLRTVSGLVSQHICEILYRKDLNRKYVFETLDGNLLKKEHLDSNNFINFCELDS